MLEEQPICKRQPLKAFLVLPFQRITRLKILLQPLPHFSQGRWLVHEGELHQVLIQEAGLGYRPQVSMKSIHLHLFNDLLLLSHLKE
ncbi:hypothetical protein L345_14592, partial [Ophiophagus hannah]